MLPYTPCSSLPGNAAVVHTSRAELLHHQGGAPAPRPANLNLGPDCRSTHTPPTPLAGHPDFLRHCVLDPAEDVRCSDKEMDGACRRAQPHQPIGGQDCPLGCDWSAGSRGVGGWDRPQVRQVPQSARRPHSETSEWSSSCSSTRTGSGPIRPTAPTLPRPRPHIRSYSAIRPCPRLPTTSRKATQ